MTALVSAALACLALLRWDHAPVQLDTTYDGFLTVQTVQPLAVTAEEAGLRIEKTVFIPDPTSDRVSSLTLYGVYTVGGDAGVRRFTGCTAYGVLDNSLGESGWNGFYCIDGTGRRCHGVPDPGAGRSRLLHPLLPRPDRPVSPV